MKKSLFKNLRMQSYLQLLNNIIPLVTTPYVARVLGAENSGVYSFNHSIASFFTLFALLGVNNYGTRKIAESKTKNEEYVNFWSIYFVQLFTTFASTIIYLFYCLTFNQSGIIAYIFLITLIGYFFNIQWYFYGVEEFQSTTRVHMLCRIAMVVSLFLFVKDQDDLIVYTIIMVGFEALAFILLWGEKFLGKKIPFMRITFQDIIVHIKPNLILFIPLLAMSVYQIMDKVMIGVFSSNVQGGYYHNVEKIINVPLGIFTGFSTVLLPRMTVLYSENKENAVNFFNNSLSILMMFGFAVTFGIVSISNEFVPLFLGHEYSSCIQLTNIFAPVLIIKCISNAIRTQLLIPAKQETIYIKSMILGAFINFLVNIMLIPQYGALGAIIATIIAEVIALVYQLIFARKEVKIGRILLESLIFSGFGFIMFFVVRLVSTVEVYLPFCTGIDNINLLCKIIIEVFVGGVVYIFLLCGYSLITKNIAYDCFCKFINKTD